MLMQILDQTSPPDENVQLARFGLQLSGHQVAVQVSGRWEREEEWGVSGGVGCGGSRGVDLGVVVRSAANKYIGHVR